MISRIYWDMMDVVAEYNRKNTALFDGFRLMPTRIAEVLFQAFDSGDIHDNASKFIALIDIGKCVQIQPDTYEMVSIFDDLAQMKKNNEAYKKESEVCETIGRGIREISEGKTDGFFYIDEDSSYKHLFKRIPEEERTRILNRQIILEELAEYTCPKDMTIVTEAINEYTLPHDESLLEKLVNAVSRFQFIRKAYTNAEIIQTRLGNCVDFLSMDDTISSDRNLPLYILIHEVSKYGSDNIRKYTDEYNLNYFKHD